MGSNGFYFLDPRLTAEDYERMATETAGRNSEMLDRNGGDLDDCFVSSACHDLTIRVYHMLAWMILDEQNQVIGFAPYKPARAATLAKRGYMESEEEMPAAVRIIANGAGMAGLAGAYPVYVPDTRNQKEENNG